jgi:adenosine deaminase
MPISPTWVRGLPKVELHLHIEGTLSAEDVASLAKTADVPLPRPVERLFTRSELGDFLTFLDWQGSLVHTRSQAVEIAYNCARRAHADGIVYAEIIVNPTHWTSLDAGALLESFSEGFDVAERDGLTACVILPSLRRNQTTAKALQLVEWMHDNRALRIGGLSIDGKESLVGRTGARFAPAFERAAAYGFARTVHAGESSGPEGVIDAVTLLNAERIDHGVRAIEDPTVVALLVERQIPLNICVTSNLVHLFPSMDAHPIGVFVEAGIPVTINTDDPQPLDITLTTEMCKVADHLAWTEARVAEATRAAINAAFCDRDRKSDLIDALGRYVAGPH